MLTCLGTVKSSQLLLSCCGLTTLVHMGGNRVAATPAVPGEAFMAPTQPCKILDLLLNTTNILKLPKTHTLLLYIIITGKIYLQRHIRNSHLFPWELHSCFQDQNLALCQLHDRLFIYLFFLLVQNSTSRKSAININLE